jgi:hypothetical protein
MSSPADSFESATSDSWRTAIVEPYFPFAASCWRWCLSRCLQPLWTIHRPGIVRGVARRWLSFRDSAQRNSPDATISIPRNGTIRSGQARCVDHAGAEVCTDIAHSASCSSHRRFGLIPNHLFTRLRTRSVLDLPCAAHSSPVLPIPNRHSNPIAAASAANANGFLLVCLSKTPRPESIRLRPNCRAPRRFRSSLATIHSVKAAVLLTVSYCAQRSFCANPMPEDPRALGLAARCSTITSKSIRCRGRYFASEAARCGGR